jgi:osmotically-inducible protein OsmY
MARQPHEGDPGNDRDLEQRVTNFLKIQRIPGSRAIQAQASQGVVTLRGMVSSFYHRQLCAHACHRVAGVRRVIDEIHVMEGRMALAAAC